ncbi:MAG: insulinase family protein [Verrucomicrobiales bacterium]|nr:insulinase family protein [Verrucomicrobiales bacterium]
MTPSTRPAPRLDAEVHTLPNGLEVLIRPDPSHPLVSVQVWVRTGSIHEEAWTGAGLAHCVEHMMFKGTTTRTAEDLTRDIQAQGGYVNAYTSFDRTVYWIEGLKEKTAAYLDVLADMMRHVRLDAEELAREQDVIRREMAMDVDDPDSTLHHLMQSLAFRSHPLGHPIIGHREIFDQVSHQDVVDFVARHYVPNHCFLVIAGDVRPAAVLKLVEKTFGGWERRRYEPIVLPVEPAMRGVRRSHRDFPTEVSRVALGWGIPGDADPQRPALDVLGMLLGSGRSSRLFQHLREQRGIAHQVGAGSWGVRECGLFEMDADCDPTQVPAVREGLLQVLAEMRENGPSEEELAKAVRATQAAQLRSLVSTRGQASALGHCWLLAGSTDLFSRYLEAVQALTPQDITAAAREHLSDSSYCEATVGPPPPRASSQRRSSATRRSGSELFDLGGGLRLLVRSDARLPLVSLRAQFLGGVPAETDANAGVTMVSSQLLLKGTSQRSASAIQSELENRGGSLICTADAHRRILGADVMAEDQEQAIDLLADLMLRPTLPEAGLAEICRRQIAAIREEREDPLTIALRRARAEIFAGRPFARTALGTESSINALDVAACRESLRRTLCRANGVISVIGDVDPRRIRDTFSRALTDLPEGRPAYDPLKAHRFSSKPGAWEEKLDKEQAVLVIGYRTFDLHHPDNAAIQLIDEACSDMGSRLFNRIREELGLAYYVGAQAFSALTGGALYFYLGTAPEKLEQAQQELQRLLAELSRDGLEADELERARATWRSSWLRAQQGNAAMADILGWNLLNGRGGDYFAELPQRMEAVTVDEVRRVCHRWLAPKSAFTVRITRPD